MAGAGHYLLHPYLGKVLASLLPVSLVRSTSKSDDLVGTLTCFLFSSLLGPNCVTPKSRIYNIAATFPPLRYLTFVRGLFPVLVPISHNTTVLGRAIWPCPQTLLSCQWLHRTTLGLAKCPLPLPIRTSSTFDQQPWNSTSRRISMATSNPSMALGRCRPSCSIMSKACSSLKKYHQPPASPHNQYPSTVSLTARQITYLDEYYLTNDEIKVLEDSASSIVERIPEGAMVIELGSG